MKIRTDYVTNSSSSSFILAFSQNGDMVQFAKECEEINHLEFLEYINRISNYADNKNKQMALEKLYKSCSFEIAWELSNELADKENITDRIEKWKRKSEIESTQQFKDTVYKLTCETTDYLKKRKQIEDADYIIMGEVWDTDDNVLGCAVRNGLIEDNFERNCVMVWNVG